MIEALLFSTFIAVCSMYGARKGYYILGYNRYSNGVLRKDKLTVRAYAMITSSASIVAIYSLLFLVASPFLAIMFYLSFAIWVVIIYMPL